jgi:hypothetical protein
MWARFVDYLVGLYYKRKRFAVYGRSLAGAPRPRTFREYVRGQAWIRLGHELSLRAFRRRLAARNWERQLGYLAPGKEADLER